MARSRLVIGLGIMALVATACGARLPRQQLLAGSGGGTGVNAGTERNAAESSGDASATGAGAVGSAGTPGSAGTAGSSGTAGGAGGAKAAGQTATPAGGNGGATDVGVTATEIVMGNVATVTGPVPGLFSGATYGAQAFAAYQNSLGGIYGRKIRVVSVDDHLDDGTNKAQVDALIPKVFGFLGSFSVNDYAGADDMQKAGVPDVGFALSQKRQGTPVNFSPAPNPLGWRLGSLNYFKSKFGDGVVKQMALFWIGQASSRDSARAEEAAAKSVGYDFVYKRELSANETNFTSDVVNMQSKGVKGIFLVGDVGTMVRMAKAMKQQGFDVPFKNWQANAYDPAFVTPDVRDAVEGSLLDQQVAMYAGEDAGAIPEVGLFLKWLHQVKPDQKADLFAAYSWAAGRLFTQAAVAAGPKLTRQSLLDALRKIDNFDDNGMFAPAGPASKRPPTCFITMKVTGGKFVRADPPSGFRCNDGDYFYLR